MNELFLKVINMSMSASWIILAVLLLRVVLKKAPKWGNVLLWGIVAVRLICPFAMESPVSLMPDSIRNGDLVSEWMDDNHGNVDIHQSDSIYYDAAIGAGREPIADGEDGYNVMPLLSIVWALGMMLLALYTVISYFRLHRRVDTAVRYKDNIFQSENVSSPFVLGIIRPRIYIPFHMDEKDLEHVIAYEKAHIQRKDHWWKPLGFLLVSIHWFNPLIWMAYVLLCRDIELACDEKVIKNKKPAFWMSVIALVVCIVIAVCFLTDPISTEGEELEVISTTKWDCSVTCTEEPDANHYAITYSDKQIVSQTGVLSFQNQNNFDIVVHILSEGSFSRSVELPPDSGIFMLQIDKSLSYKVGIHAEVAEGTEIRLMVYDGEKTEIYSRSEEIPEDISIVNTYEVTNSELVDENLKNNKLITMVKYYEMSDGTWKTDSYTYQHRLEITGRMGGAVKDSTFVFLSNIEDISFEQAWKAAGFSSNMNDYFKEKDAKFVAMK